MVWALVHKFLQPAKKKNKTLNIEKNKNAYKLVNMFKNYKYITIFTIKYTNKFSYVLCIIITK